MNLRLRRLCEKLEDANLDSLVVTLPSNITYLCEYTSRDSYFLVSGNKNIYFTDSRYAEEAKKSLKGAATVQKPDGSVFKSIASACLEQGLRRVGFEERYLPFAEYSEIKKFLKKNAQLIPSHNLIEDLRQVKETHELQKIRKSIQITKEALKLARKIIAPGKSEIEIAGEIERFIRYRGASSAAFDIIVAAGVNSSYPHHISSGRKIRDNEPVLVDMGVTYEGYKCDLTRVFFLGKINSLVAKIYDIVLRAQQEAIKKVIPAETISKVDKAARQYITEQGYGGFFGHNLGHGVGLDTHENPHIGPKNAAPLEEGMVFTVEPGIYLAGKFGIRIEDMVLVTKRGAEVLSGAVNK
ncbi:MAG: Xaa-Pro peptidase family protein [Candidatus Omnitrophota bacterium]